MEIFNKRYIVNPVQRATAQDRHIQELITKVNNVVKSKQLLKKTKAVMPSGKSAVDILKFKRSDTNKNVIDTGMDKLIPNPFYAGVDDTGVKDVAQSIFNKYSLPSSWRGILEKVVRQQKIPIQTLAEIYFSLEPDELTNRIPKEGEQTMVSRFSVVLYDRANLFETNNLRGFLAVQLLKKRTDKVHRNPYPLNSALHNWTMIEQSKMYHNDMNTNMKQNKTIARYVNFAEKYPNVGTLSANPLYWLGVVLIHPDTGKSVLRANANLNTATIDSKINDFIKEGGVTLEERLTAFNEVLDLFEQDRHKFFVKYLITQAKNKGVMVLKDGFVYWLSQHRDPAFYKFSSFDAIEAKMYQEMLTGSDKFVELINELEENKVPIPDDVREIVNAIYKLTQEKAADEGTVEEKRKAARRGRPRKTKTT